jgi:GMP synthase (glutamine-hydrolysing)
MPGGLTARQPPYTPSEMEPVLLVRNDPFETFGVAPAVFEAVGVPTAVWEAVDGAPGPALDEVSGLIVLGSSYNVEHADEQPFIREVGERMREAVDRGTPLLGVCFGAQALAWALGAEVRKAPIREMGFEPIRPTRDAADDLLLSHYDDGDHAFQWHMDTYDLPDGATLLATGDGVRHQAFRVGDRAWGVQFHFEIDADELELWLEGFAKEGDLLEIWGKSADQVRAEATEHLVDHERKGSEVFRRFAELAREVAPS